MCCAHTVKEKKKVTLRQEILSRMMYQKILINNEINNELRFLSRDIAPESNCLFY